MGKLSLTNVSKTYGEIRAIDNLSIEIADGEFFVILGPSGAGKTSTLKAVAGLIDLESGEVHIGGNDMTNVEPYQRNVGMAFESYALYPQKTVYENLASPLISGRYGTFSKSERDKLIADTTTMLGIGHLQDRLPKELSNGQRQRVALGRVLVRTADIYLLDEPLSHLDAKLRAAMRAQLKKLGSMSNTTTLYVTHDYQEALALGDRIGVMCQGQLVQVGTPEEVWNTPVDTFVAKALGQPEINLVSATVTSGRIMGDNQLFECAAPSGLESGPVLVGVRPRELDLVEPTSPREFELKGRVEFTELLGRLQEVTIRAAGQFISLVIPSETRVTEGQDIALGCDLSQVHLFAAPVATEETPRLGSAKHLLRQKVTA